MLLILMLSVILSIVYRENIYEYSIYEKSIELRDFINSTKLLPLNMTKRISECMLKNGNNPFSEIGDARLFNIYTPSSAIELPGIIGSTIIGDFPLGKLNSLRNNLIVDIAGNIVGYSANGLADCYNNEYVVDSIYALNKLLYTGEIRGILPHGHGKIYIEGEPYDAQFIDGVAI